MVAALGVEPRWSPYKEAILPLNDAAPKLGREGVNRPLVVGTKIQRPAIERPRAGAPGRIRTPVVPGRNGMHKSALPQAHSDSGARCWSRTNLTGLIRAVPHRWVKRAKLSIVARTLVRGVEIRLDACVGIRITDKLASRRVSTRHARVRAPRFLSEFLV